MESPIKSYSTTLSFQNYHRGITLFRLVPLARASSRTWVGVFDTRQKLFFCDFKVMSIFYFPLHWNLMEIINPLKVDGIFTTPVGTPIPEERLMQFLGTIAPINSFYVTVGVIPCQGSWLSFRLIEDYTGKSDILISVMRSHCGWGSTL